MLCQRTAILIKGCSAVICGIKRHSRTYIHIHTYTVPYRLVPINHAGLDLCVVVKNVYV